MSFNDRVRRAVLASLFATCVGAELVGIYVAVSLWVTSGSTDGVAFTLLMILAAPILAVPWVLPIAIIGATLLSPFAVRIAPFRTRSGLAKLGLTGSACGFALLFLIGLGISYFYTMTSPVTDAIGLSYAYGPIFGGLTAVGWWLQSPRPEPLTELAGAS